MALQSVQIASTRSSTAALLVEQRSVDRSINCRKTPITHMFKAKVFGVLRKEELKYCVERNIGKFERMFQLPENAEMDQVIARG
ncbi:Alpha-crystallin, subunit A [Parasponia andersonii]|uniref:Alpha-crystallin, subunit A n=1 Tax=Parasponia andersonii TaxID=3476 RepID=A0A2P5D216_PARAD|nr:Alpha-crystallin, subunit A [Parasponia andersonii]